MRVTRVRTLLALAIAVAGIGWLALDLAEGHGVYLSPVHWMVDVVLVLLALGVLAAGWPVREYLRGRRPDLDGLRAARTVVLATAAAITGALLAGWYAAQALVVVGDLLIEARRDRAVAAAVAVVFSVLLCAAGLVVERWCRLRGDGHDGDGEGGTAERSPTGTPDPA